MNTQEILRKTTIREDTELAKARGHKYIRKVGNRYIYKESAGKKTSAMSLFKLAEKEQEGKAKEIIKQDKGKVLFTDSVGKQYKVGESTMLRNGEYATIVGVSGKDVVLLQKYVGPFIESKRAVIKAQA